MRSQHFDSDLIAVGEIGQNGAEELEWRDEATWSAARERARRRRLAWARQESPGGPAARAASSATVVPGSGQPRPQNGAGTRAWSLNVEMIERERVLRGWTQRELSRNAHVDQGTLCDLLARRRRPTFGTVQAICTTLRLTLAQVIVFPADGQ
jgi:hypothetical protein